MKLEIGKSYRKANGTVETVGGVTRYYRDWVWTIQGNWYRQSDGRFIGYRRSSETDANGEFTYEHVPLAMATGQDLIEENPK